MDEKEKQQEPESEISKAFGNESEEQEPNKADPKADEPEKEETNKEHKQEGATADDNKQKGKTYTQEEVDAMMAKARKKYKGKGQKEEAPEENVEEHDADHEEVQEPADLATGISIDKYAQAELKGTMAMLDVDPKKIARAVRLIDVNAVMEDGNFSEDKAKAEIEALIQEWPELKRTSNGAENNSFSFGAPRQDENEEDMGSKISSIFGNK